MIKILNCEKKFVRRKSIKIYTQQKKSSNLMDDKGIY